MILHDIIKYYVILQKILYSIIYKYIIIMITNKLQIITTNKTILLMELLQCMSWAQHHHSYSIRIQLCRNYWQLCICIHYCGSTAGHAFLAGSIPWPIPYKIIQRRGMHERPKEHVLMFGKQIFLMCHQLFCIKL